AGNPSRRDLPGRRFNVCPGSGFLADLGAKYAGAGGLQHEYANGRQQQRVDHPVAGSIRAESVNLHVELQRDLSTDAAAYDRQHQFDRNALPHRWNHSLLRGNYYDELSGLTRKYPGISDVFECADHQLSVHSDNHDEWNFVPRRGLFYKSRKPQYVVQRGRLLCPGVFLERLCMNNRIRQARGERGFVLTLYTLMMLFIIVPIVGLAIDSGIM